MYALVLLTTAAAPGQCYGGYAQSYANGNGNGYARAYANGGGCYGASYAARPAPPPRRSRALRIDFEDRDSRLQFHVDRGDDGPAVYESRVPARYRGRTPCEADDDDGEIVYNGPAPRYAAEAGRYREPYRPPPPRYRPAPQVRETRLSLDYTARRP